MLKVIKTGIITENGQEYEVKKYSNGTEVKSIVPNSTDPEPPLSPEEQQSAKLDYIMATLT